MAGEFLYWSDLLDQPVYVSDQGRQVGRVNDFYYDPETQAIAALRIVTSLQGSCVLLASAIMVIDVRGVTIVNENMLIDETNAGHIYQLPLGQQLIGVRVVNEQGHEIGVVSRLLLGIYPPVALRISALELGYRPARRISAHSILRIERGTLTIMGHEG